MPASPARRLGLAYTAVVIGAPGLVLPVAAQMPARVLFLHSYHPGYQWIDNIEQVVLNLAIERDADVEASTLFLRKPFLPSERLARARAALGCAGPVPSPSRSPRVAP